VNYNIQVLRALASLWVLCFHALPFYESMGGSLGPLRVLAASGYLGVDLFFVISGFIIARTFPAAPPTAAGEARRFIERRAWRIYVGYWPVLAVAVAAYALWLPERLQGVDALRTLLLLSHRIPDLVIGQAWSLSFELFFYLAFALLMLVARSLGRLLAIGYGLAVVAANLADPGVAKGFFANPGLLELLAGMLLGQAAPIRLGRPGALAVLAGAGVLLAAWFQLSAPPRLLTVALVGSAALLLVLLADAAALRGRNSPSLLSRLGDSSYALYLVHYLLLELFGYFLAGSAPLRPWLPLLFGLWLAAIVVIAHGYYLWLERPLHDRLCRWRGLGPQRPPVDVIIPVYRGLAETRRCIESAIASCGATAAEIVVVDDAGPEAELRAYLDQCAAAGRLTLLRNERNLGFVAAVNRGMALHPQRDVVLLNSDTEVANDWLDRLRGAAHAAADIGTVTPLSNNATICSYPYPGWSGGVPGSLGLAALDRLIARTNAGRMVDLPTAVGFCMYIRRACLDQVGPFDAARFGRGYGEENDFCLRALALGWRSVLAGDVFVFHQGSVSFGDDRHALQATAHAALLERHPDYMVRVQAFVDGDAAAPLRAAIDAARRALGDAEAAAVAAEQAAASAQERALAAAD
jgi:O-antigen biosynthesis protein